MSVFYRKPIPADDQRGGLLRTLGRGELIVLGVGAAIGYGIFIVAGSVAATTTGPALPLAYLLAGCACFIAGLCYAELASAIPLSGGAYSYAYVGFGELPAWLIGCSLILFYGSSAAGIAIGWVSYVRGLIVSITAAQPVHHAVAETALRLDLIPAVVVLVCTAFVFAGARLSVRTTTLFVLIKIAVLVLLVLFGGAFVQLSNWQPFVPANTGEFGHFGWSGIIRGAAMVFFSYVGFEVVSTAAEEARNPKRDVPVAILATIAISIALYVPVALVITGLVPFTELRGANAFAAAIARTDMAWLALWIQIGAVAGLSGVLLAVVLALTRVMFAMSQDGLLPTWLGRVHPRSHTPVNAVVVGGVLSALIASTFPLDLISEFAGIGALVAYTIVCIGVPLMRRGPLGRLATFHTPGSPFLPLAGAAFCLYLLSGMAVRAMAFAALSSVVAVLAYLAYGRRNARFVRQNATGPLSHD